ncbi:hypothetical protein, partial [Mycobacterium sp.]|uniref:hypothetical protein n=1 Tax=Mycobacterium sp. TaxID=1785 RepID=UPI00257CB11C
MADPFVDGCACGLIQESDDRMNANPARFSNSLEARLSCNSRPVAVNRPLNPAMCPPLTASRQPAG